MRRVEGVVRQTWLIKTARLPLKRPAAHRKRLAQGRAARLSGPDSMTFHIFPVRNVSFMGTRRRRRLSLRPIWTCASLLVDIGRIVRVLRFNADSNSRMFQGAARPPHFRATDALGCAMGVWNNVIQVGPAQGKMETRAWTWRSPHFPPVAFQPVRLTTADRSTHGGRRA